MRRRYPLCRMNWKKEDGADDDLAADCFYQNEIADGMDLFMANVAKLGTNKSAAPWINPIFDAIERADYTYAADLLYHEIQGE